MRGTRTSGESSDGIGGRAPGIKRGGGGIEVTNTAGGGKGGHVVGSFRGGFFASGLVHEEGHRGKLLAWRSKKKGR